MRHDLLHGESFGGILAKHLRDKIFCFRRDHGPVLRVEGDLLFQNVMLRLIWINSEERQTLGQNRVEHHSQTPNIRFQVIKGLPHNLRGGEGQASTGSKNNLALENYGGKAEI